MRNFGTPPDGQIHILGIQNSSSVKHVWQVLYLFADVEREADLGSALRKSVDKMNFTGGAHFDVRVKNLDILRGGSAHALLSANTQGQVIAEIKSGTYHLLLLAPPCSTFSRALFSDRSYPQPARDFRHPQGLPSNGQQDRQKV